MANTLYPVTPKQVAALVVFPKGVPIERVKKIMDQFQRGFRYAGEEPEITQIREFDPEHGGITLYQP
jgi:hypothetical protein